MLFRSQGSRTKEDHCGACNGGYELTGAATCAPYGLSAGKTEATLHCDLAEQALRTKDDHCGSCHGGYWPAEGTDHASSAYGGDGGTGSKCGECPDGNDSFTTGSDGVALWCLLPTGVTAWEGNRMCYCHGNPTGPDGLIDCAAFNDWSVASGGSNAGVAFDYTLADPDWGPAVALDSCQPFGLSPGASETSLHCALKQQALRTKDDDCGVCHPGYGLSDGVCSMFEGDCLHGSLIDLDRRTDEDHCGSCGPGYYPEIGRAHV